MGIIGFCYLQDIKHKLDYGHHHVRDSKNIIEIVICSVYD